MESIEFEWKWKIHWIWMEQKKHKNNVNKQIIFKIIKIMFWIFFYICLVIAIWFLYALYDFYMIFYILFVFVGIYLFIFGVLRPPASLFGLWHHNAIECYECYECYKKMVSFRRTSKQNKKRTENNKNPLKWVNIFKNNQNRISTSWKWRFLVL